MKFLDNYLISGVNKFRYSLLADKHKFFTMIPHIFNKDMQRRENVSQVKN